MPVTTRFKLRPWVFGPSSVIILGLVALAALFPASMQKVLGDIQARLTVSFSWFYMLSVGVILGVMLFVAFSRFGSIRLGPDHAKPKYSRTTWFAMLFSTGMGIGMLFFGVAEPLMHYLTPPTGEGSTPEAAKAALELTFFHWGLHAWGIYASVGLLLAYFAYRRQLPLTLRSALYPLLGDKIYGAWGHAVDVFAIVGTVFGVATSLGFGVLQINGGLHHLFGIPVNTWSQSLLILGITCLAGLSVGTGLDKGIKWLSNLNLAAAVALLVLLLILGPTTHLLDTYIETVGAYLSGIVSKTFMLYAYEPPVQDWLGGWTLLYWGWWLSWSPFVGMFIARISRGRTIREFIMGVLLVPSAFTLLWMTVFGSSAIEQVALYGSQLDKIVSQDVSVALFAFLEAYPLSQVLSGVGVIMVVIFFVTSADSGALVADALASGGASQTPVVQRLFWAALSGICAWVLLIQGGLKSLQTLTLISALPFAAILLIALYGLLKALQVDDFKRQSHQVTNIAPQLYRSSGSWEQRLKTIVHYPEHAQVREFLHQTVVPCLETLAERLRSEGLDAEVMVKKESAMLSIHFETVSDFVYDVRLKAYGHTEYEEAPAEPDDESAPYVRAEVFLLEGSQDYDIMGWSREQVFHDVLDQYEKHLTFLRLVNAPTPAQG